MNRKQRAKRSQERNERDWEKIEPLIRKAVDLVWKGMDEVLQSRYPKDELVNHLWLRDDWINLLQTHSSDSLILRAKNYLWQLMGGTGGCSESRDSAACAAVRNRELIDGDEETAEEIYHNAYRAEPADPSDIVADGELLEYIMDRLTQEEKEILATFLSKDETLAAISKRRRCCERTIRRQRDDILAKVRRWAIEQGWNK